MKNFNSMYDLYCNYYLELKYLRDYIKFLSIALDTGDFGGNEELLVPAIELLEDKFDYYIEKLQTLNKQFLQYLKEKA